jgi:hypothetical protein
MGASPGPDGPKKKIPRVRMTMNYLWLGSGVDCPRFRKMATNGSAWGQVSNRKIDKMAAMEKQQLGTHTYFYLWVGSWEV